jgi:capsular polysaccharide biosynthesis protein
MINNTKRSEEFDSSGLIVFIYKWRKPLLIVCLIALFGSWFFSCPWFITPKFKSIVILFPAATNSVSKALMSEQSTKGQDLMAFGEDEQAEQLLQILNSNKIRDRIIQKFHLMKHYDIDTNYKYKNSLLYQEYEKNIKFNRTEYMAVKISVYDKDPQMAADIANKIGELLDSTKNEMQHQRAVTGYKIVEGEYLGLKAEVDRITDSLITIGKLGVNDVEYQSQAYNQQMAIAIMNNKPAAIKALQKKLDILGMYGGIYLTLQDALKFKTEQLTLLQTKFKQAKVDAEENLPQKFVVNDAYKAEEKSYPVRWLIVLVSTFSALFLAIMVLIILEKISAYNKHKEFNVG